MKKFSRSFLIFVCVLVFVLAPDMLPAQITFTQPDTNNFGITTTGGLFGTAWGDYDGDGDMDFYQPRSGNPSVLYRNEGGTQFVDASAEGVLVDSTGGYAQGAIWGDFDNDGDVDLLSVDAGLKLYQNDDNMFTDISETSGLSLIDPTERLWQATAGDYDQDGDLDIALAGADTKGLPTRILNNENMVFTDVADNVIGFELILESWNPMWVDVDNDGDQDLWMPTIRTPNEPCTLLKNQNGELVLVDPSTSGLVAKSAITSSWADYDNDGDMDLFVVPFSGDNDGNAKLFKNNGDLTFTDVAPALGLDSVYSDSRGVLWADYDNDGDQDLLVTLRSSQDHLWRNDGGSFTRVSEETGMANLNNTRQMQFVDYDNDGFLDLYLGSQNGPVLLLHNSGNSNHWIGIRPRGTTNNAAGIGARIRVVTGSLSQVRDIQASAGGMSNGYLWGQFGLGTATVADSVIVTWPNGTVEFDTNIPADQYHIFAEGKGITAIDKTPNNAILKDFALYQNYPNPFNALTTISFNLPARSEVRLVLVNMLGEEVKVITQNHFDAGYHQVQLDGSNLATGIYFYRLEAGGFVEVKKLVLLK